MSIMNLTFLSSLFKPTSKTLSVPDSMLIKKLKSLSHHSNLIFFSDVAIYHHSQKYQIPLFMLDELRGLYIFEIKSWSYDDLKNATIQKAEHQASSQETLSFDNTQEIIRKKFNELTHNDGVPIFNYLIMENLSADEYEHLNDSFKKLLPLNKLIFSDSPQAEIFEKLQKASAENHSLPSANEILGTLLIQYAILDENNDLRLCTQEQIDFINKPLKPVTEFNGAQRSGKSNILLLKALVEHLNAPKKKILILKPTLLACDILKKKLLDIVEHAIVEVDLTSIEILTPIELVNRHLDKLKREQLSATLYIDDKLMHKNFHAANIIMCDDAFLYDENFIAYLYHLQKKSTLLLVNPTKTTEKASLKENFLPDNREVYFHNMNPHAKTLHLVHKYLQTSKPEDILIISNASTREKLIEDLNSYIESKTYLLDSSQHLIYQNFEGLTLATYQDINTLSAKHTIILDLYSTSMQEIEYAFNIATTSVNVIYEEDCQEITSLKAKYESDKE